MTSTSLKGSIEMLGLVAIAAIVGAALLLGSSDGITTTGLQTGMCEDVEDFNVGLTGHLASCEPGPEQSEIVEACRRAESVARGDCERQCRKQDPKCKFVKFRQGEFLVTCSFDESFKEAMEGGVGDLTRSRISAVCLKLYTCDCEFEEEGPAPTHPPKPPPPPMPPTPPPRGP